MAWNRAYHPHTLPGQSQGPAVVGASTAPSVNSDEDDYEVNNEQKTSRPAVVKNVTLSNSVHSLHQRSDWDYVNAIAVIANQRSLTLPHQHRSGTFSGTSTKDYGCKTLPMYVNVDDAYNWLMDPNVHHESEGVENEPSCNMTHSNDNFTMSPCLPIATLPRATGLAPQDEKSHSYQNLPLSPPSQSSCVANPGGIEETEDQNASKSYESQSILRLESFTFRSAFVNSICRALQEEQRQAEQDLQIEQDGYVRMQSISLKPPEAEEVIAINMEVQIEEEGERSYYNVIPPPKS